MKIRILSIVSVLMLVMATACSDDDGASPETSDTSSTTTTAAAETTTTTGITAEPVFGTVRIEDAWARTSPTEATNGEAFMTLNASADDRLIGAMTADDIAESVEIHETGPVDGIDLPADEDVVLEPGGYHISFVNLTQPLEPGTTFDIILTFEIAGDVAASVEVRDSTDPDAD